MSAHPVETNNADTSGAETLPISVFIITKNEAHNLSRLLPALTRFREVIVVDSGSTDDTVNIAQRFGARVIHQQWLGFAAQKQIAFMQCSQPWALNLDADELPTKEMISEMAVLVNRPDVDAVRFKRRDFFIDALPPVKTRLPNNCRLYRTDKAQFNTQQKVHETAQVNGCEVKSDAAFYHYGYNEIEQLVAKLNCYSSLRAKEKWAGSKQPSLLKLVLILPLEFIRQYCVQRLFLFGRRGFILATLNAQYAFLKEAKLMEQALSRSEKTSSNSQAPDH
ncbi:glycosyltransferase family 2 protein [Alteromonas oceanisediminis]|uniref:glycosyltransferase family 2 protein n=1 Tax=Alteromonas oceanisediminis TaxID=2836180 RepID=UPI001BDA83DA|nr:glycosyltransferase family 2 protein [Alteromonas oceanisediminis]MBT0586752.1 glycosyltransferase family 2 protein [Alteromonas oceanisediminis]